MRLSISVVSNVKMITKDGLIKSRCRSQFLIQNRSAERSRLKSKII
jgi:hypothetical protein